MLGRVAARIKSLTSHGASSSVPGVSSTRSFVFPWGLLFMPLTHNMGPLGTTRERHRTCESRTSDVMRATPPAGPDGTFLGEGSTL